MECNFYIAKLKRNCKRKASNNKLNYCNFHNNKENNNEIKLEKNKINNEKKDNEKCIFIIEKDLLCNKKSYLKYENNNYCKKHYNNILLNKKKSILNEIKRIEKMHINDNNKSIIKKDIYKLLLTIHPDKCKIPNIDCHTLTQNLTDLLNKLKI